MQRLIHKVFPAPFEFTLVVAFSFVAALSIGVGSWVISRTIDDYLSSAMNDRIGRDMRIAQTFYNDRLNSLSDTSKRLAMDTVLIQAAIHWNSGQPINRDLINQEFAIQTNCLLDKGNHAAFLQSVNGLVLGGILLINGKNYAIQLTPPNRLEIPIIQKAISSRSIQTATEVVSITQLELLSLGEQANIPVISTERASPTLFDNREGRAGLVLISVSPLIVNGQVIGAITVFHLLNNDYTLVDHIKTVAGIDTATIFLGDQRISTNVLTMDGKRAVGTRLAQDVGKVVLYRGQSYIGPAFVVNQNYITRYDPIRDHTGKIVGILYVGASQDQFLRLVQVFNQHVLIVAILSIFVTFILAIPVAKTITRPLKELEVLAEVSEQVGKGNLNARMPYIPHGEVGLVAKSFNSMLDKLQAIQEKLIQSEKLVSLGQLAAGVAHELNNPLATILLYADILQRELGKENNNKEDLQIIIYESLRCKNIVAALLNFARQTQINAQPTNLNQLIQDIVEVEKKHPRYQNIEIELNLDPELPEIQADQSQIREVLINLTYNAVDAMPKGGKLNLRTHRASMDYISFEVEDTGKGIPPENMTKLFTPFFTTKPIGKGTGLGLAIIYGIIKMHRGQINVQSKVGQGTKFTILLPSKLAKPDKLNRDVDLLG